MYYPIENLYLDEIDEAKKILQDACDRTWEDETLLQTCNIVANAITWRDLEINNLKAELGKLPSMIDEPEPFIGQFSKINQEEKETYWPYGW